MARMYENSNDFIEEMAERFGYDPERVFRLVVTAEPHSLLVIEVTECVPEQPKENSS